MLSNPYFWLCFASGTIFLILGLIYNEQRDLELKDSNITSNAAGESIIILIILFILELLIHVIPRQVIRSLLLFIGVGLMGLGFWFGIK